MYQISIDHLQGEAGEPRGQELRTLATQPWVQIPALLLTSWVTWGKSLNHSEPQRSHVRACREHDHAGGSLRLCSDVAIVGPPRVPALRDFLWTEEE